MAIKKTPFGDLDADLFEDFCDSFSLGRLGEALHELETVALQIADLRNDLHKLYTMAAKLIEAEHVMPPAAPCKEGNEIWALADELSLQMVPWLEQIDTAQELVDGIAQLAPDPDDDDYWADDPTCDDETT
ncbi:hypothetical protein ACVZEA_29405 [Pseudomonas aeruginosa]